MKLTHEGQRFLLTCHVLPDADAVGSMLGLAAVLRSLGKEVVSLQPRSGAGPTLSFLPGANDVAEHSARRALRCDVDHRHRRALALAAPAAAARGHRPAIVIIDHHLAHDDFGDIVVARRERLRDRVVVLELAAALGVDPLPRRLPSRSTRHSSPTPATSAIRARRRRRCASRPTCSTRASTRGASRRTCSRTGRWNAAPARLHDQRDRDSSSTGRVAILCVPLCMLGAGGRDASAWSRAWSSTAA